jgi:cobalamin biosynthesis protein CobT
LKSEICEEIDIFQVECNGLLLETPNLKSLRIFSETFDAKLMTSLSSGCTMLRKIKVSSKTRVNQLSLEFPYLESARIHLKSVNTIKLVTPVLNFLELSGFCGNIYLSR